MGDILCGNFSTPRCLCCHYEEKDSSQQDNMQPLLKNCMYVFSISLPLIFKPRRSLPFGNVSSYLHLETLSEGPHSVVCKGISSSIIKYCEETIIIFCPSRIYNQLVALKVISLNTEEGIPFTAIREDVAQFIRYAEIEKFDKSKLKKTGMQEKSPLPSGEKTDQEKQANEL
ncbi:hypothetical protein Chor_015769 [Crotalus horridus]